MSKKFFFSSLLLASWITQADEAFFCTQCTSDTTARQVAAYYAPPLYCTSPNPDDFMTPDNRVCSSSQKKVVLVNPDTKTLYSYFVGHTQIEPWSVTVIPAALTSSQRAGYLKVVDFYHDYKNAVAEAENTLNANVRRQLAGRATASADTCPVNTALDYYTDPTAMATLRNTITLQLATGLKGNISDYFQSGAKVNNAGISLAGHGVSIGWNSNTKKPVFIKSFDVSEVSSSINDTLIFDMELIGFDPVTYIPQILFKVHDASRLAGYQVSDLKGNFGPQTITNNCVLEKLQRLTIDGEFRDKDGKPVSIGGGGGLPGTPGGGGGLEICTIYFYQNGQLLYTFRTAC